MTGDFDFEDFDERDTASAPSEAADIPASAGVDADAVRVAGYEEGYKTGWDDAVRATEEDGRNVGAELARNLRDLGFTYFEARDEVLAGLESFLADLLDTLFPVLLPEAVAASLAAELTEHVKAGHDGQIEIRVSPGDLATVQALVANDGQIDVSVAEEAALAPGQALISSVRREVAVDIEDLGDRLRAALNPLELRQDEETDHARAG